MADNKNKAEEDPKNIEKHREKLAEIIINDLSITELRQRLKEQLMNSYKISPRRFLREYWKYFEETGGHCPFGINSD